MLCFKVAGQIKAFERCLRKSMYYSVNKTVFYDSHGLDDFALTSTYTQRRSLSENANYRPIIRELLRARINHVDSDS